MGKYQKNFEAARRITVMQYLETYHPGALVRKTDRAYCTRTHDSLIITTANGFFQWFSRNVGGNNAIDYLTKVEGMDFVSAVRLLNEMVPVSYTHLCSHLQKITQNAQHTHHLAEMYAGFLLFIPVCRLCAALFKKQPGTPAAFAQRVCRAKPVLFTA